MEGLFLLKYHLNTVRKANPTMMFTSDAGTEKMEKRVRGELSGRVFERQGTPANNKCTNPRVASKNVPFFRPTDGLFLNAAGDENIETQDET